MAVDIQAGCACAVAPVVVVRSRGAGGRVGISDEL